MAGATIGPGPGTNLDQGRGYIVPPINAVTAEHWTPAGTVRGPLTRLDTEALAGRAQATVADPLPLGLAGFASATKSRRLDRKQANQLRGQINRLAKEKAYAHGTVTVEVNPHGTSQYCSRCGARGERFSLRAGRRVTWRGGKLFWCPASHYQVQADFNASVNLHHSFYREVHWQPRPKRSG